MNDLPPTMHLSEEEWIDLREAMVHRAGAKIIDIDLKDCLSSRTALRRLGTALSAPSYYRANMDALADIIRDREKGIEVFVVRGLTGRNHDYELDLLRVLEGNTPQRQYGKGTANFILISP